MSRVRDLHEKAMDLAEMATIVKIQGDIDKANQLLRQALEYEAQAAKLIPNKASSEPARSILCRSAASLALDCKEFREAERLIATGLAGNPPNEIAQELRVLFEEVNFQRHGEVRGICLRPNELQMSLAGNAISAGIAPSGEFIPRIEKVQKIFSRTVERIMKIPYRESGTPSDRVQNYSLFMSVPRASSFAVSLRLSSPKQLTVCEDAYIEATQVIDEVLTCLELFNQSNESKLQEKIPEPAYYSSFVGLAKNMAPDGKEVNFVGFTTMQNGVEKRVILTNPRDDIKISPLNLAGNNLDIRGEKKSITGKLLFADATKSKTKKIKLIDKKGSPHMIIVPEGMMNDIIKPLWEETVIVKGTYHKKEMYLEDIRIYTDESL